MKRLIHYSGFTLIELVIVIVLLGILSAIALPQFLDLSTDARRSVNNGIAGSLASAIGTFAAHVQMPPNAFSPNPATSTDPNGNLLTALDMDPNKPTDQAIYLWFGQNGYPVGGSTTAKRIGMRIQASINDPLITNTSGYEQACATIFNALLNDSSSRAGVTLEGNIATISDTSPYAYQVLPQEWFIPDPITIPPPGSFFDARPAARNPSCIWINTSSMDSDAYFYIYYNQGTGQVIPVESDEAPQMG